MRNPLMGKSIRALLFSVSLAFLLVIIPIIIHGCETPRKKSYVIGIVNPNPGEGEGVEGFVQGLTKYGYEEGKNTSYIKRESGKNLESAVRYMVSKHVD